jgi:hypothetical protein
MWHAFRGGDWWGQRPAVPSSGPSRGSAPRPTVRADRIRYLLLAAPDPLGGRQAALRLRGVDVAGELDLRDVTVAGPVAFNGCTFDRRLLLEGMTVPALSLTTCTLVGLAADRLVVERGLVVTDCRVDGSVYVRDGRIGAQFDLTGTVIEPADSVAIDVENIRISGDFGGERLTCRGFSYLNLARIDGALILTGARIHDGGILAPSLAASGVYARRGFHLNGYLNLCDAVLTGPLELSGATIEHPGDVAIKGSGMTVTGSVCGNGDTSIAGTVDLAGAEIRGGLQLDALRCKAPGPQGSLRLPRAVIRAGVHVRWATLDGPVDLVHAQVSASVDFYQSEVNAVGAAAGSIDADNISVIGDFTVRDAGVAGSVTLRGAHVEGTVDFGGTRLGQADGCSIGADGLVAFQLTLAGAAPPGDIDLSHAAVEVLDDEAQTWPAGPGRPVLAGFTYRQLRSTVPVRRRLDMLRRATPSVEPQPYEQLAACYRNAGHERQAREILREKLRRESRAAGRVTRLWGLLQDVTTGYGYLPGRAAAIFTALLLSGTAYFGAAAHCAGTRGLCPVSPTDHPTWDPFLYTLDVLVPVIDLGHEKAWDPTGVDKAVTILLLASGWILVTTLVAALGRALNRS